MDFMKTDGKDRNLGLGERQKKNMENHVEQIMNEENDWDYDRS